MQLQELHLSTFGRKISKKNNRNGFDSLYCAVFARKMGFLSHIKAETYAMNIGNVHIGIVDEVFAQLGDVDVH